MEKNIRLDKYLADMGLGTRSEVKVFLRKGLITLNGAVVKQPELKISPKNSVVCYNGTQVSYTEYEYYMLNKPQGCVSATEDRNHKTVLDYVPAARHDLFPVGRLDIDTEGLLLVTNDGALAHHLLSPRHQVDKTYYAKIRGRVTVQDVRSFAEGLDIGEKQPTRPARLEILVSDDISEIHVTITEGRFHQVKRMFEAVGKEVLFLKRLSMGSLVLDEHLLPGECRSLTQEELAQLKE